MSKRFRLRRKLLGLPARAAPEAEHKYTEADLEAFIDEVFGDAVLSHAVVHVTSTAEPAQNSAVEVAVLRIGTYRTVVYKGVA